VRQRPLVQEDESVWQVVAVKVGELHGNVVEILDGLQDGLSVMGHGAILLKPFIIKSLQVATAL
jgi:hypothetical protein